MVRLVPLALFGLVLVHPASAAADDAQKRAEIIELLSALGTDGSLSAMIPAMTKQTIAMLSAPIPNMPKKHLRVVREELTAEFEDSRDEFYEAMTPRYKTAFAHEEIKALLAFWKSAVGQKMRKKLPEISQAAMPLGRQLGVTIGKRALDRIKARLRELGYKI